MADEHDKSVRNYSHQRPQWAANGAQIVFFHNRVAYMVDAAGSRLESLDDAIFPNVSPDGSRIAYTAFERYSTGWLPWSEDHNYEVVSSKLDGSDRRRLSKTWGIDFHPVWSPNGTRIAFVSLNEDYKNTIHVMGADGSDARIVAPSVVARMDSPPVWSPDGRSIAFFSSRGLVRPCSDRSIRSWALYIAGADGSEPREIGLALESTRPAWSLDSQRVTFSRLSKTDCHIAELQTVALDGSELDSILLYPRSYFQSNLAGPLWDTSSSPNGSEILMGTLIIKEDGSAFRTLPMRNGIASWSPDGSRIAVHVPVGGYASSPRYKYHVSGVLYTMASDGSDIRVLVEQDEEGNLTAANGRPLSDDRDVIETHDTCFELAEPGVLKYCDEE